tara:strand:- start:62 stop:646 length:585 start_codon:yes stop_codon:yes gene_type:complete
MQSDLIYTTRVIQHSHLGTHAVFVFEDLFDDEYLQIMLNKTYNLTQKDTMNHATNVKGNMTSFDRMVDDPDFEKFHRTVISLLTTCVALRTPNTNVPAYRIDESWGLKFEQGQHTLIHTHLARCCWSGTFCLQADENSSEIFFPEFNYKCFNKANSLFLFPSSMIHGSTPEISENPRISLAFNIIDKIILQQGD